MDGQAPDLGVGVRLFFGLNQEIANVILCRFGRVWLGTYVSGCRQTSWLFSFLLLSLLSLWCTIPPIWDYPLAPAPEVKSLFFPPLSHY